MNLCRSSTEKMNNSTPIPSHQRRVRHSEANPYIPVSHRFGSECPSDYHQTTPYQYSEMPSFGPSVQYYQQQMPQLVSDVKPNDVLSGRGGATNSHSGNRAFRSLVKQYQNDYLKAKKRDKPQVAAIIVAKIREKGGRFLRRCPPKVEGVFWVEIGDAKAREKTCQALREGAPEIRRKRAASESGEVRQCKGSDGSLSAASTIDRNGSEGDEDNKSSHTRRTQILRTTFESEKREAVSFIGGPMVIRPSVSLLYGSSSGRQLAIPVDHLGQMEREIYLRDFLPPNPSIRRKRSDVYIATKPVAERVQSNESRVKRESERDLWDTIVKV